MARRFPDGTGARLRGLLRQAAAPFPDSGVGNVPTRTLVLEHLCANAVDAMTGTLGPNIGIASSATDRQVQIKFWDNGKGIRPGGKGYGLARSRELLEHYGGRIALGSNARGTGALFLITLRAPPKD